MSDNVSSSSSAAGAPELGPQSKIAIVPDASAGSNPNGNGHSVVEKAHSSPANGVEISPPAPAPPAEVAVVAANKTDSSKLAFNPISPGLSSVKLPLGPSPKEEAKTASPEKKEEEEPPVEAKVGDLVELFMGRGQVRGIRQEDGMLEVWAVGWEMAGEQRARFFVPRETVKVVPTVYYKMNALERLQMAAWLKEEGAKLFKAGDFEKAATKYMKSIGVLKTGEFTTNAQNARAVQLMIPCHNNAATCYIKRKNYGDARLLTENVDTLCSALERNRDGKVMKELKERGVGETTILGQWWCKGLFLGGKACLYQSENEEAVNYLKKGSRLAKPAALAKLRAEINNELEKATKRLASQTKKAQKMWSKAFSKNSTDVAPEQEGVPAAAEKRALPSMPTRAMDGRNGGPEKSVVERLEALAKMGVVPAIPEPSKTTPKQDEEQGEEGESEEEEYDSEYEYDDDEGSGSLASSGLLWGSLAVGAVALSVATLVALGKRR
ncbi:conserved unknown protein [Ectocarpus siliculosus]|uniref:Peptidylprolyl isomerase n=1 Tax=Ectocarpus siliculosus TaxID=2880 RepID=D8LNS0_ECTSI|nr:conserved unknown protein [Ectocarpus siliculosus]|eukprot:CBN78280.1 conserved unknown protein [Ectocarpus siliculosus]